MCLHEVGGDAERGWAFGGIEPCHQPAGSGAEGVEPAPSPQARRDLLDGARHLAELGPDRLDRREVLGVHQLDEIERGEVVELVGPGMQVLAHGRRTSAAAAAQTRAEP